MAERRRVLKISSSTGRGTRSAPGWARRGWRLSG